MAEKTNEKPTIPELSETIEMMIAAGLKGPILVHDGVNNDPVKFCRAHLAIIQNDNLGRKVRAPYYRRLVKFVNEFKEEKI